MGTGELTSALERLRSALAAATLPLPLPGAESQKVAVRTLTNQLDDYLLPRLAHLDAPLLTVVGGSTGAGKSTLVNSLVGRVVSTAGVIRPTTRASVLIHHPDDTDWFGSQRVLPGLGRSSEPSHYPWVLQLVPEPSLPRGLALLDAPDIDSVVTENRALADQLLGAADLWLFVTSAARYADAVPWRYLREAADRSVALGVVVDRVPPAAWTEVPSHLGQLMLSGGLGSSPLFAVPETKTDAEGLLPEAAVAPIREWLEDMSSDRRTRHKVVLQTLDGALVSLCRTAPLVATAVDEQAAALAQLRSDADASYAEAARAVSVQTADGTMLRGEVLTRWHDLVGTGEFFRVVERKIGRFRDRIWGAVKGEPKQAVEAKVAVESGLETLIRAESDAAAERAESAWRAHPAGRELIAAHPELGASSSDFAAVAARIVREWQGGVLELVSEEGKGKRVQARFLALGVNGVGVALMILVFSQTGGLVGAEIGIAGGTAVLAQRLLEAVFGEDAVRRLATRAKTDLDARVEAAIANELVRYHQVLEATGVTDTAAEEIRAAVDLVVHARSSSWTDVTGQLPAGTGPAALPARQAQEPAELGTAVAPGGAEQVPEIVDAEIVEDRP
ncbi:ABC transporter [Propionicicella superfundia]|uniref:ABC transporter n=1 Tax=Propionicicella superfundia TaxID=348582 RepID=UPI00042A86EF|nr:ABC transporter [Propionicicella superfundia]